MLMVGLAFSNAATLARKRSWFAFSVAGGRPLTTRVTGPSATLVSSPPSSPHAAAERPRPAASSSPRAVRSLDVNMGRPSLCDLALVFVFRGDDDTKSNEDTQEVN